MFITNPLNPLGRDEISAGEVLEYMFCTQAMRTQDRLRKVLDDAFYVKGCWVTEIETSRSRATDNPEENYPKGSRKIQGDNLIIITFTNNGGDIFKLVIDLNDDSMNAYLGKLHPGEHRYVRKITGVKLVPIEHEGKDWIAYSGGLDEHALGNSAQIFADTIYEALPSYNEEDFRRPY